MNEMGLTDHFLIEKYLLPLLEAKETKFFKDGEKRINVAALGIRHTALDTAFKLRGSYARADDPTMGMRGNTIIIDIPRPPRLPIDVSSNGHKPPEEE
jgi:hypothetical protein